jgi:predicted TIM-barrel fold metal-dependent hydrolase
MTVATAHGWDCHAHVFDGHPALAASHYRPPLRPLSALEDAARAIGVGHVVLVQPSVYGSDNSLLLESLRSSGGRHRGVIVADATLTAAGLRALHELGVRGVRFNLVSPVGNDAAQLEAMAPALRELGWHVQWYAAPAALPTVAALHRRLGLRCVLDHLGGTTVEAAREPGTWVALRRLADQGGWIKLSGWYRLGADAPYGALDETIARCVGIFGERCVWGSDWPHTRFLEPGCRDPAPAYADTWAPVVRSLGTERAQRILDDQPAVLYA